ncbi:MAG TPA: hypothetical protein PK265_00050 [Candidatus Saccharibacteria bacterium]|nr:hypothetical protein [Candidatus Saccharibacteria bacterium]HRQ97704.1 hypothetical protein [Candidatus Saccharibacteria bacterium]
MDKTPKFNPSSDDEQDVLQKLMALSETVENDWSKVVESIRGACLELIEVDELVIERLGTNFWPSFTELMERESIYNPDILKDVLSRSEEISTARRQAEMEYFETVLLPKLKRRRFWRSLLGQPYDITLDYEVTMSEYLANKTKLV